jgi:hypothetical protein
LKENVLHIILKATGKVLYTTQYKGSSTEIPSWEGIRAQGSVKYILGRITSNYSIPPK